MVSCRRATLRYTPFPANQTQSLRIQRPVVLPARTKSVSCRGNRGAKLRVVHYLRERSEAADLKRASQRLLAALIHVLEEVISGQYSRDRAETHPLSRMRRTPCEV